MDAVKFIEERNRMCRSHDARRIGCKAFLTLGCCEVGLGSTMDAPSQVAIVEKWSKENPRKTRQSEFLKLFPEAELVDNVLALCPIKVSACYRYYSGSICAIYRCSDCRREFWMQEIEEN